MEWLFLFLAGVVYFLYAWLSFDDRMDKDGGFYFFANMALGFLYALLWYWATRFIEGKEKLFVFTLLWDFIYVSVFYFAPLLLFGVKIDRWSMVGLAIMMVGLTVIKVRSH